MRRVAIVAFAVACGARTEVRGAGAIDAGAPFPVGAYARCAFGTVADGPFLIPSGLDEGAKLTVTGSGPSRVATYVDGSGKSRSWTFTTTTSASASLAPSPQTAPGFGSAICVYGVGVSNEKFFPTELHATSGALTYESGVMFVSLAGDLGSHTDCGDVDAPAAAWITCADGPAPDATAPASSAPFALGEYACTSQVGTKRTNEYVTSGGAGTLTLGQAGSVVTAQYAGDAEMSGALDFTMNAGGAGLAVPGQTVAARCDPDSATAELPVAAASLTVVGHTIFLSFAGTTSDGGPCPGAQKMAALVCAGSAK